MIEGNFLHFFSPYFVIQFFKTFSLIARGASADGSNSLTRWHHRISYSLMIVTPVAIMFGPSSVTHTLDYALGLAIPFHSHVGLNYVISDYVPKAYRFIARSCLLAVTCITVVGIFKLNYSGEGLSRTLKALWNEPANKTKKE
jgi:succinate dehydrogenase (ubiquinone) membrane anchor subunit